MRLCSHFNLDSLCIPAFTCETGFKYNHIPASFLCESWQSPPVHRPRAGRRCRHCGFRLPLFASRLHADRVCIHRKYSTRDELWCFNNELRHAFANVVGNALDATGDSGTIHVRVRRGHRWDGKPEPGIVVTIADSGSGIPESMRNRLFQPFFSTKEKTGTGLGLWATDNIVRKHHGRIKFRTSRRPTRHGTVFSLFLPMHGVQPETAR